MNILLDKFKEVSLSVLPITLIVMILNFTIAPVPGDLFWRFLIGVVLIITGLGIFFWGVDLGINEIGAQMGKFVAKSSNQAVVFLLGLFLGFIISVAEPDLLILARQVSDAMGNLLSPFFIVAVVSLGVGTMIGFGFLRILKDRPLNRFFMLVYAIIFIMMIFVSQEFHAVAFDSSGATTGAMTTPFILVMGLGVSMMKGSTDGEKDSFGLVGVASTGPILAVMVMSLVLGLDTIQGTPEIFVPVEGVAGPFLGAIGHTAFESLMAITPIVITFLIFNKIFFKIDKKIFRKTMVGVLYTFLGLVLFLIGVNTGFMDLARIMGQTIASMDAAAVILPILGLTLGMVVVLAEPAVYVLSNQVEEVTTGSISRKMILITLSIGVAIAVSLSMVRILVPWLRLWMFIVPGFLLALAMSFKVPEIFVGIAFDSGGVASGPMTATFILALSQGVAESVPTANVLVDGFGIIAMVAMTPVVAIMVLGRIYDRKRRKGLENA